MLKHLLRKQFAAKARGIPVLCTLKKSDTAEKGPSKRYVPRRALLYVPGSDEKKILKSSQMDVDCIVLDCEDGVAVNKKKEARESIRKALGEVQFGARTDVAVRVNSVESGLADDDLDCILEAKKLPSTILLPKVETKDHVNWLVDHVHKELENEKTKARFDLVLYVETAMGLLNLRDILEHSTEICEFSRLRLAGIVFGSDDFTASIGATRTEDAKEVLMARQQVVVFAKAYGIQAVDMVHINIKDEAGLRERSLEGARMGFTGKQVIHPAQVPVVQEAFSPSAERLEWAKRLVAEFEKHQREGKGAFAFEGSMIDMPTVLQAENLVRTGEALFGASPKETGTKH